MRQTPLLDQHKALGGKVIDFSGWALPVQYAGILHEHAHTRANASVFDCSHMGEFRIKGRKAIDAYDALITSDTDRIKPGRARYGALLNDDGGYIDDLITMRIDEDELFVVTNAGPLDRVAALFAGNVPGLADESADTAKIDIQGPLSRDILVSIGLTTAAELRYFALARAQWAGYPVLVSRTGYTGERAMNSTCPTRPPSRSGKNSSSIPVWRPRARRARHPPPGNGLPAIGPDFDASRTPLEARQDAFIDWHKPFTGRAALKISGPPHYSVLAPVKRIPERAASRLRGLPRRRRRRASRAEAMGLRRTGHRTGLSAARAGRTRRRAGRGTAPNRHRSHGTAVLQGGNVQELRREPP